MFPWHLLFSKGNFLLEQSENARLKSIIKILASHRGNSYFESLVTSLSNIIPMKYIFVGVLSDDMTSIKTIALSVGGTIVPNFEYDLLHTPCHNVMGNIVCCYKDGVQKLFPQDHFLAEKKIDSYIGFPLQDVHGNPIGIMVFLNETPIYTQYEKDKSFLEIIQILVGAELSRYISELELKEREENFRVTLDSIGDGVIVTNSNSQITRINLAGEKLTGWSLSDCYGKSLHEVLTLKFEDTEEKIEYPIDDILIKKNVVNIKKKILLIDKLKNRKHITYSGAPIYNDKDNAIGAVIVFHDVTKEFDMELQLRHTQKMEAIGQLAGGIAHDFNNILTGIIGCGNIIQRKSTDKEIVETYAGHIITSAKKTSELTRKLLDFSRKGRLLSTDLDLHQIITESIEMMDHGLHKGVEIKTFFNATYSTMVGDPSQLQNSFLNLFLNACDAMEGIGELTIKTENLTIEDFQDDLGPETTNQFIEIEIQDTGEGILPENIPKIFEPFFTTKDIGKGTGLGLAAVYGSIKDHQGAIQVWSEPSKGTKFSILLPLPKKENKIKTDMISIKKALLPIKGIRTALIVDDEFLIRHSIKQLLEVSNIKILEAENGEIGVNLYQQNANEIDLIILDLIMPKMNGITVYKEIRKQNTTIPILFISGYKKELAGIPSTDQHASFLQKPFEEADLVTAINRLQVNQ